MPLDNDFFPAFSPAEFARRRQAVRAGMHAQGLDCLIIYGAYSYAGTDTGSVNVVYLANYAAINHSYLVFPADGEPTLIINNSNHLPNARDIAVIDDVRSGGLDLVDGLVARLQELKLERASVGIVGPLPTWWTHTIPAEHSDRLAQAFPQMRRQTVTPWFENIRLIKGAEEIALLEKAAALTDLAFNELVQATRPGVRHSELRWLIEAVAARGHGKFPFGHISSTPMSDPQQIYPDFYPTHRTVQAGDIAQTELALGYGLYFGKVWGSYFVGEPNAQDPAPVRARRESARRSNREPEARHERGRRQPMDGALQGRRLRRRQRGATRKRLEHLQPRAAFRRDRRHARRQKTCLSEGPRLRAAAGALRGHPLVPDRARRQNRGVDGHHLRDGRGRPAQTARLPGQQAQRGAGVTKRLK